MASSGWKMDGTQGTVLVRVSMGRQWENKMPPLDGLNKRAVAMTARLFTDKGFNELTRQPVITGKEHSFENGWHLLDTIHKWHLYFN
jgi:hypothetical protein